MSSAPDLTLSLRDGGLVSILPSGELVKPRSEITGAHRPNGVFVAAGRGIRQGVALPPLSILDVAPTLLYALGLPVSAEIEGRIPEQLFEAGHLRLHPPQFEAPVEDTTLLALAAQAVPNNNLDMEIMGQLRALGYME